MNVSSVCVTSSFSEEDDYYVFEHQPEETEDDFNE